jgi:hypothetical protein
MVDHVLEKIKRANTHIEEFQTALDAFKKTKPYQISGKRDTKTREFIYYVIKADPIPPDLSVISGDVLQNLRTALDYLIVSLIHAHSGPTADISKCGFPIFDEVPTTKDDESFFAGKVKGMKNEAKELLRTLKPYKGGDDALWRLHALNNRDKHRLLLTAATTLRPFNVGEHIRATRKNLKGHIPDFVAGTRDRIFPLKVGIILLVDPPDSEENKNIKLTVDIVFNESGVCEGEPIFLVLRSSLNKVRHTLEKFAAFR